MIEYKQTNNNYGKMTVEERGNNSVNTIGYFVCDMRKRLNVNNWNQMLT